MFLEVYLLLLSLFHDYRPIKYSELAIYPALRWLS